MKNWKNIEGTWVNLDRITYAMIYDAQKTAKIDPNQKRFSIKFHLAANDRLTLDTTYDTQAEAQIRLNNIMTSNTYE